MDATPGSQLKSSIADASRKIESIIDDAERAAMEIRAEARAEAERESRRQISESAARLSGVVDPLIKRVESLRLEAAALVHELEAATLNLVNLTKRGDGGETEAPSPVPEVLARDVRDETEAPVSAAEPGPAPVAYPGTGAPTAPFGEFPEGVVLRATQMAVAGNSRSEIEAALSDDFGLPDPTRVVDEILGPANATGPARSARPSRRG